MNIYNKLCALNYGLLILSILNISQNLQASSTSLKDELAVKAPLSLSEALQEFKSEIQSNPKKMAKKLKVQAKDLTDFFSDEQVEVSNKDFGFDRKQLYPLNEDFLKNVNLTVSELIALNKYQDYKILVAGAGLGRKVIPMLEQTFVSLKFIINDIDPRNFNDLKALKQYFTHQTDGRYALASQQFKRLEFIISDISRLNFDYNNFDGIVADNVLHFMSPHQIITFFDKAQNWLKPNAQLFINAQTPNGGISDKNIAKLKDRYNLFKTYADASNYSSQYFELNAYLESENYKKKFELTLKKDYAHYLLDNLDITFLHMNPNTYEHQVLFYDKPISQTYFTPTMLKLIADNLNFSLIKGATFDLKNNMFRVVQFSQSLYMSVILQKITNPLQSSNTKFLHQIADQDKVKLINFMKDKYLTFSPETCLVYTVDPKICLPANIERAKKRFQLSKLRYLKNKNR